MKHIGNLEVTNNLLVKGLTIAQGDITTTADFTWLDGMPQTITLFTDGNYSFDISSLNVGSEMTIYAANTHATSITAVQSLGIPSTELYLLQGYSSVSIKVVWQLVGSVWNKHFIITDDTTTSFLTFNATTNWTLVDSTYVCTKVLSQITSNINDLHKHRVSIEKLKSGAGPSSIYENVSVDYTIDGTNIKLIIPSLPDNRFAGRVIID